MQKWAIKQQLTCNIEQLLVLSLALLLLLLLLLSSSSLVVVVVTPFLS